ncbi:TPA: helix-turn-helix transcriptional regulator, partial [Acinetobacter baumannii]|nr:helix-turn-helix transcriptional regulator [Acinetobacter baumannii]
MMYSENDSPVYIASVLGERLKRIRLNRDMTQAEVASKAWISRRTVLNAEKGNVKLSDLIAILAALNMINNFNVLIP